jgi:hypothetical protein
LFAELPRPTLLTGQTLRSRSALLRKALLPGQTLLTRRAAWTLLAELLGLTLSSWPLTWTALSRPSLSGPSLSGSALLTG